MTTTNKINPIAPDKASETAKTTLDLVNKKLGRVPLMYQVMANSPAVLDAYVKFNSSLSAGAIGSKMAELIALAVAEENGCSYCLSAHAFFGKRVGLTDQQIDDGRQFKAADDKTLAGLQFVGKILKKPGEITSGDLTSLRSAGFADGEILELVANAVRNILTNYINILAGTEVDWPVVVNPKVKAK